MEDKLCRTNRQFAVRQLSGSFIHVYQVLFLSFLAKKTGSLANAEEDRARPPIKEQKKKQKEMIHLFARIPPSQQTEAPDHAIDGVKPFLDFFLPFSNRKQVMHQHANNDQHQKRSICLSVDRTTERLDTYRGV